MRLTGAPGPVRSGASVLLGTTVGRVPGFRPCPGTRVVCGPTSWSWSAYLRHRGSRPSPARSWSRSGSGSGLRQGSVHSRGPCWSGGSRPPFLVGRRASGSTAVPARRLKLNGPDLMHSHVVGVAGSRAHVGGFFVIPVVGALVGFSRSGSISRAGACRCGPGLWTVERRRPSRAGAAVRNPDRAGRGSGGPRRVGSWGGGSCILIAVLLAAVWAPRRTASPDFIGGIIPASVGQAPGRRSPPPDGLWWRERARHAGPGQPGSRPVVDLAWESRGRSRPTATGSGVPLPPDSRRGALGVVASELKQAVSSPSSCRSWSA
jgi:hypothetical protein